MAAVEASLTGAEADRACPWPCQAQDSGAGLLPGHCCGDLSPPWRSLSVPALVWLSLPLQDWEHFQPIMTQLLVPLCLHQRLNLLGTVISQAKAQAALDRSSVSMPLAARERVANATLCREGGAAPPCSMLCLGNAEVATPM